MPSFLRQLNNAAYTPSTGLDKIGPGEGTTAANNNRFCFKQSDFFLGAHRFLARRFPVISTVGLFSFRVHVTKLDRSASYGGIYRRATSRRGVQLQSAVGVRVITFTMMTGPVSLYKGATLVSILRRQLTRTDSLSFYDKVKGWKYSPEGSRVRYTCTLRTAG